MEKKVMGCFGLALGLVIMIQMSAAQMTCEEVLAAELPCKPYLTRQAIDPAPACCEGINTVFKSNTEAHFQVICHCVLDRKQRDWGIDPVREIQVAGQCSLTELYCLVDKNL
ncbi:hypothetical protein Dsin_002454 [Dipteronia sinensis]|uniref:Bifunctional inhibitor/plant lipid transfer protein/seed storage helical domain-containing protein n=1 Tax=Dipteronia sinensis TaxID=43782 RepID=A0AAE0EJA1_9ROSI|nr:hypothetical protein Dsin_002454 [Dipteronia sinensis]